MVPGSIPPPRCGKQNLGSVEPSPPGEDATPSPSFRTCTSPTYWRQKWWSPRSIPPPYGVETTMWGSYSQRHPRRIISHPCIINLFIYLQRRQTGDDNDGPPRRYRLPRCRNPNRGLAIATSPPSEDDIPSPDQNYFRTCTTSTN